MMCAAWAFFANLAASEARTPLTRALQSVSSAYTHDGCLCRESWTYEGSVCEEWCCNPDGDSGGPWCFVENSTCEGYVWGYCSEVTSTTSRTTATSTSGTNTTSTTATITSTTVTFTTSATSTTTIATATSTSTRSVTSSVTATTSSTSGSSTSISSTASATSTTGATSTLSATDTMATSTSVSANASMSTTTSTTCFATSTSTGTNRSEVTTATATTSFYISTTSTNSISTTTRILATSPQSMYTVGGCLCRESWSYLGKECTSSCCNPDDDPFGEWCMVEGRACSGKTRGYCYPSVPSLTPTLTSTRSATTPADIATVPPPEGAAPDAGIPSLALASSILSIAGCCGFWIIYCVVSTYRKGKQIMPSDSYEADFVGVAVPAEASKDVPGHSEVRGSHLADAAEVDDAKAKRRVRPANAQFSGQVLAGRPHCSAQPSSRSEADDAGRLSPRSERGGQTDDHADAGEAAQAETVRQSGAELAEG
ncbi:unnamed protein product [Effrenium voratum]|nr:unnamed protein product [Effrenium voratum]